MTTTARQATTRIANTAALADLVIYSNRDHCENCDRAAAYLYCRVDESGTEVRICEDCADSGTFGCFDCD